MAFLRTKANKNKCYWFPAFHDCVSDTCDGCINMDTNPSNAGLQPAIDALINVKALADDAGITITWADLMALSGVVGSEYGMLGMPGNKDTVKGKSKAN